MNDVDNFLAHVGVKGMRWGVRKKSNDSEGSSGGSGGSDKVKTYGGRFGGETYTESRREFRKRVKAERAEFFENNLNNVVKTAAEKGDKVLVRTFYSGDMDYSIVTGREFVASLSQGNAINTKLTDLWAVQDSAGDYREVDYPLFSKPKRK